ncbi:hypothetical protein FB451DRAFT_1179061 [Mycena latifolia]|nr:hypothetical protein FB451DRAFT_1179061 [Mycena latifolia]
MMRDRGPRASRSSVECAERWQGASARVPAKRIDNSSQGLCRGDRDGAVRGQIAVHSNASPQLAGTSATLDSGRDEGPAERSLLIALESAVPDLKSQEVKSIMGTKVPKLFRGGAEQVELGHQNIPGNEIPGVKAPSSEIRRNRSIQENTRKVFQDSQILDRASGIQKPAHPAASDPVLTLLVGSTIWPQRSLKVLQQQPSGGRSSRDCGR